MTIFNREKKSLYFYYIKNFFSDSRPVLFFFSTQENINIDVLFFFRKNNFFIKKIKLNFLKLFFFKHCFIFPSFGRQYISLFSENLKNLLLRMSSLFSFLLNNNFVFSFLFYNGIIFNFFFLKQILFFKKSLYFIPFFYYKNLLMVYFILFGFIISRFFFLNVNLSTVSSKS
jgi:hypothetical protein